MKRREFIGLVGGAAAWPIGARAQQAAVPLVGWLGARSPDVEGPVAAAFRKGLAETGYIEGRNVAIESHWAYGQNDRLPALAADLLGRQVSVLVNVAAGRASGGAGGAKGGDRGNADQLREAYAMVRRHRGVRSSSVWCTG
jgi:putative tryptophan/tyrosine transport system substrate-binding protein